MELHKVMPVSGLREDSVGSLRPSDQRLAENVPEVVHGPHCTDRAEASFLCQRYEKPGARPRPFQIGLIDSA